MQLKDIEFKHIVLFAFLFIIGIYVVNHGEQTFKQSIKEKDINTPSTANASNAIKGKGLSGGFSQTLYSWSCGGDTWGDCENEFDAYTQECCLWGHKAQCIEPGYDCSTGEVCGGDTLWCKSGDELFCVNDNPLCFDSDINKDSITKCGGGWHACYNNDEANCVGGNFYCCPSDEPYYDSNTGGCHKCVKDSHCSGDEVCENHKCRPRNYCERNGECSSDGFCNKDKNECQKLDCDPGLIPKNHECVYGRECVKDIDCMWCGTDCVTAKDVYHCPKVKPPEDKVCTCSGNACAAEDKICNEGETETIGCLNNKTLKYRECKNNEWNTKDEKCSVGNKSVEHGELIPICKNSTCNTLTKCNKDYKLTEKGCVEITIRDKIIRFFKRISEFLRGIFR